MAGRKSDGGRAAVIWLATAYTAVIGAGAAAFVIVVAAEQPRGPLIIWGLTILGLIALVTVLNIRWSNPVSRLKVWLFANDRTDPTDVYRAARRGIQRQENPGNHGPPTIESVRDAANHGGAWVPRSSGQQRPPASN